jgi:hypothetical protein
VIVREVLPPEVDEDGHTCPWHVLMVIIDTTKGERYWAYNRASHEFGAEAGFRRLIADACDQIREQGYEPILGEVVK